MPRPKVTETYEQLIEYLFALSNRHKDGNFTASSLYLKKRFGRDYKQMIDRARTDIGLRVLIPATYKRDGSGKCTTYRIDREAQNRYPVLPNVLTTEHKHYLAARKRTNLTGDPWIREGINGDGRFYTDFSLMPREERARVTIDNKRTVTFDIPNAFPWMLSLIVPACESDVFEHLQRGTFYEALAELVNANLRTDILKRFQSEHITAAALVTRTHAKFAVNKAFNTPRSVTFGKRVLNSAGNWYTPPDADAIKHRLVWQTLQLWAPRYTSSVRMLAKSYSGATYYAASQMERGFREAIVEEATALNIAVPTVHDGFTVAESDADVFEPIFSRIRNEALRNIHPHFLEHESEYQSSPIPFDSSCNEINEMDDNDD